MMLRLSAFLEAKPLYYKEIDHRRVHRAYGLLKPQIKAPKTIHLVGTNGKGSTGRIIAHLADKSGISVGHYSSPHILTLNERFWLEGADASDEALEKAHQRLYPILGEEMSDGLSYFEYTTLLALVLFEQCELLVLEAGLGGEFDATNVCDKALSVITPIGIDHQDFLGETIEEIAMTKINSIQTQMLLAPQHYNEVRSIAQKISQSKNATLLLSEQKTTPILEAIAQQKGWAGYLVANAKVAMEALELLTIRYDIEAIGSLELFGRFYPLEQNIRIDVGHNPLASSAMVGALEKDTVLIYNSLDDKDYEEVLRILKPKVKRVEIIEIENTRALARETLIQILEALQMQYSDFANTIEADESYLVFGSFYVVEAFLKQRGYRDVSK